jgi:hypothetical protein
LPELLPPAAAPPVVTLPPLCPDTLKLVLAPEAFTLPLLAEPLFVVPLEAPVEPAAVVSPKTAEGDMVSVAIARLSPSAAGLNARGLRTRRLLLLAWTYLEKLEFTSCLPDEIHQIAPLDCQRRLE